MRLRKRYSTARRVLLYRGKMTARRVVVYQGKMRKGQKAGEKWKVGRLVAWKVGRLVADPLPLTPK